MALAKLSRSVEGSAVLVTGAASGIGRATAHVFADAGARLALVDRNADALEAVRSEVAEAGGDVMALSADLSDRGMVEQTVSRVVVA